MIGNDIVCLYTANQSKHVGSKRFLDKIFTVEEQQLIVNSVDSNLTIWKLWAVKESAYKLLVQQGFKPEFAPKKIICKKENDLFLASIWNNNVIVNCRANTQMIYAQTISEKQKVINRFFRLDSIAYQKQSNQLQLALKKKASEILKIDIQFIHLLKTSNNIPRLTYKNALLPVNISITHHGYYGAYALALD